MSKPNVYLTTPVFNDIANHSKVTKSKKKIIFRLWDELEKKTHLKVSPKRFPKPEEIKSVISGWKAQIIGCHLSHQINEEMLRNSNVFAICTSTAGYNHIPRIPGMLITHTPGVLHRTVADFTIALILSNLRNTVKLHNLVWEEKWKSDQKWDLDYNLSTTMDNQVLGVVGMGEIGQELTRRIAPWGIKTIYYDPVRRKNLENKFNLVNQVNSLEKLFSEADIISLHLPLNPQTQYLVGEKLLRLMKKNALLVNTARGPIVNFQVLLDLLEKKEISLNLAFDVFENEPLKKNDLKRFKKIAFDNPNLRFVFLPHNASADANTRAQMAIMLLEDILTLTSSRSPADLKTLRLIPEQHYLWGGGKQPPDFENYKIFQYW